MNINEKLSESELSRIYKKFFPRYNTKTIYESYISGRKWHFISFQKFVISTFF